MTGAATVRGFMSIRPLLQDGAFDPETVELLAKAFDEAWASMLALRPRYAADDSTDRREEIARRIVAAARRGERDVGRLAADALAHLTANRSSGR
jgi:hypothetical protein